jgi:hypothetical protein
MGALPFSPGLESYDYNAMRDAHGKKFDHFIKKCSLAYVLDLHSKCDFALHDGLYDYGDDEDGDD